MKGAHTGDLLWDIRIWKLPASITEVPTFLSILVYEIYDFLPVKILPEMQCKT
jgi:hypothetical protein